MTVFRVMAWTLASAALLLVASCETHPWFKSRFPWEEQPDPNQQPVITNSAGERYHTGTPSWVPLVDDCLREGGNRTDCIDSLPAEELEKFHEWEQNNRRMRHRKMGAATDFGYRPTHDPQ